MTNQTASAVTLDAFAEAVGCHFTTASRLKSGERLPGRELLGRIIKAYSSNPGEAMAVYTRAGDARGAFGDYLRTKIFEPQETSVKSTQDLELLPEHEIRVATVKLTMAAIRAMIFRYGFRPVHSGRWCHRPSGRELETGYCHGEGRLRVYNRGEIEPYADLRLLGAASEFHEIVELFPELASVRTVPNI